MMSLNALRLLSLLSGVSAVSISRSSYSHAGNDFTPQQTSFTHSGFGGVSNLGSKLRLMRRGDGTFYSPEGGYTSCGGMHTSSDFIVAMNAAEYGNHSNGPNDMSPWCGKCIKVEGPRGWVVVQVQDKCPGCKHGDVDLSEGAFKKIAAVEDGRVKVTWSTHSCAQLGASGGGSQSPPHDTAPPAPTPPPKVNPVEPKPIPQVGEPQQHEQVPQAPIVETHQETKSTDNVKEFAVAPQELAIKNDIKSEVQAPQENIQSLPVTLNVTLPISSNSALQYYNASDSTNQVNSEDSTDSSLSYFYASTSPFVFVTSNPDNLLPHTACNQLNSSFASYGLLKKQNELRNATEFLGEVVTSQWFQTSDNSNSISIFLGRVKDNRHSQNIKRRGLSGCLPMEATWKVENDAVNLSTSVKKDKCQGGPLSFFCRKLD